MNVLCWFGVHEWHFCIGWWPSVSAEIVTHYWHAAQCLRCGKRKILADVKWNSQERQMVECGCNGSHPGVSGGGGQEEPCR